MEYFSFVFFFYILWLVYHFKVLYIYISYLFVFYNYTSSTLPLVYTNAFMLDWNTESVHLIFFSNKVREEREARPILIWCWALSKQKYGTLLITSMVVCLELVFVNIREDNLARFNSFLECFLIRYYPTLFALNVYRLYNVFFLFRGWATSDVLV